MFCIMSAERKRAPNFTVKEKVLLINIIHSFKNIIENKQTNSTTWREKDAAWTKIADTFNSQSSEVHLRSKETLKKYYDNIKRNVRKEAAEEQKELCKTGGGAFEKKNDPVKELTLDLLNKKTVYGLNNPFDGDSKAQDVVILEVDKLNVNTEDVFYADQTEDHTYHLEETQIHEDLSLSSSVCQDTISNPQSTRQTFSGHVSQEKTPSLNHKWTKRRRPTPQSKCTIDLNKEYLETSKVKKQCLEAELINIEARRHQEEALFELQKESLMLDIEIKKNS